MRTRDQTACRKCGYRNPPDRPCCDLCGELLRATVRPAAPRPLEPFAPAAPTPLGPPPIAGLPAGLFWLIAGAPIAFLFSSFSLDILSYMGWFLAALVHEMGHCVVSIFFGTFAFPAIRLDGHAAAIPGEPSTIAVVMVWAALGYGAWRFRDRSRLLVTFCVAAALYPLFAFTDLQAILHLAGGHLGELAFATLFFWRAMTGGSVKTTAERPLYAALGWFWMAGNVLLFGSLVWSEASRQWYLTNGSFGLQNDFVRMAATLGVSLPAVAFPMLLLSLTPLPIALRLTRR